MKQLLIGCGNDKRKKLDPGSGLQWDELVTLDHSPACGPHVVHDLNEFPYPFANDTFDEIHAYCVLEHCGRQGDARYFFRQWEEFWRILKPDGVFCGQTPRWDGPWAWGDPSHTRIVGLECLTYLDQQQYTAQVGHTAMTDFREIYRGDFVAARAWQDEHFNWFVLRARK